LNDAVAPIGGTPAAAIRLTDIRFRWKQRSEFELKVPTLVLGRTERVLLVGPSGSGKSTLLSLISGVALPQKGKVEAIGTDLTAMSGAARDRFRADHFGIIFQMFNLIPYLSALDNILLPLRVSKHRRARVADGAAPEDEAKRLMTRLGLDPAIYAELDNLRAAMAWALRSSSPAAALRLSAGLWLFCSMHGHYAEGSRWLDTLPFLDAAARAAIGDANARTLWRIAAAALPEMGAGR